MVKHYENVIYFLVGLKTFEPHFYKVTTDFKLAGIKLENSEAYLPKLEKNLSWGFEIIDIFRKNAVLNICRYLKRFYAYKKIKLKFDHSLLRMPKIIEIG